MDTNNIVTSDTGRSALEILQDIKSGLVDSKTLDKSGRQQCVELLMSEGYTHSQIGQVLKCSEKTVYRDLKEIRKRNELSPNMEFAKQFIGDMFNKAMNHHGYLMRLARTKDATTSEKAQSEFAAWKVLKELIDKLQSLGYLPSQPTEIIGNIYHHQKEDDSPEAMRRMLFGIEEMAKDAGALDQEVIAKIGLLKTRIDQSEIAVEIKQLEDQTSKKGEGNENEPKS